MKNNVVGLRSWLDGKTTEEAARIQKIAEPKIVEFIATFAADDVKADSDVQEAFITSLCKEQGLSVPAIEETPRTRLIFAVYGKFEDLVTMKKGDHDSKGGKRITAAIRAYQDSVAGRKRKRKERDEEVWPRKTYQFVAELMAQAKPAEKKLLDRLIARVYGKEALQKVA